MSQSCNFAPEQAPGQNGLWVQFRSKVFRVALNQTPVSGQLVLLLADDDQPSDLCTYNDAIPAHRVFGCVMSVAHPLE